MSLESSRCIQCAPSYCSGKGECWRFGLIEDSSSTALCKYGTFDACMEVNGPGSTYVDPERCLVYFNDNGWTPYSTNGVDLAFGMYGATNQSNPIPTNLEHITPNSNTGISPRESMLSSRIWAYDIIDNSIYYVDSLTHEGSDVAMGVTNLWVGCEYNIQPALPGLQYSENYFGNFEGSEVEEATDSRNTAGKIANLTINEYKYTINGNDPNTFSKTPTKVYRFVNEVGTLLSIRQIGETTVNNSTQSSFASQGASLGNSIASIDDDQIIFDSETANYFDVLNGVTEPGTFNGNIWYAKLTELWSGETITANNGAEIEKTWITNNSTDEGGNKYFDTNNHEYNHNRRDPSDGWFRCAATSVNEEGRATTLPIYTVVAKPIIELDSSFTQGDIEYVASDPVYGNNPSVIVTYWNAQTLPGSENYDLGCPQNPGNGITQNNQESCTKNIARWAFPNDLTNITVQKFNSRTTESSAKTESQSNTPVNSKAIVRDTINNTLFTTSGAYRWRLDSTNLGATNPINMNFRLYDSEGNGQLHTWNDYHNIGNQEKFTFRGGAQIPSCVDITAYTYTCSVNGCYATLGTAGTYTTLSACSASCLSYSCKTECGCPAGYIWNPTTNLCEDTVAPNQNSPILADKVSPTSWGHNGTRMCVDRACNDYYATSGPQQPLNINPQSGFWGSGGSFQQARLNSVGVWPGNTTPPPSYLNYTLANPQWFGITRCVNVSATSVYLVGVAAESHFRVTINNVVELDTTTALNNFDPNGIGLGNTIMSPGSEAHGKWWIQRFELPMGQNVITVEGAHVETFGGTYQAGLGTEVVGPFPLTSFTSSTSYTALTVDVYTANTVFSTSDIIDIEVSNNCNLSLPIVPYSIFGTMPTQYVDTYNNGWCLNGMSATNPATNSPYVPNQQQGGSVPFKNTDVILNYPWFADSSVTFTDLSLGYNNTPARNLLFKDFVTLVETDWSVWPNVNAACTQFPNATVTANCVTDHNQVKFTNEFFQLGGFKKTGANSSSVQTYQVWQPTGTYSANQNFDGLSPKFYRWVDFIGWLNQNGLSQSGVASVNSTNYPAIDNNATYFEVMYAIWNYWSPTTLRPNPSVNELEIEVNNSYSSPNTYATFLPNNGQLGSNLTFCECTTQNGYLDTQVFDCPIGYVYDGCQGICVTTTACTTNQTTGFAGGCYELPGTGITNTYTSQTQCTSSCDTVASLTYYSCTTTGVTVVTGTTTPYTSSAAAESACYSYNCSSTGCTIQLGSGGTYATSTLCYANCTSYNCTNWGCQQQVGTAATYSNLAACSGVCNSFECLSHGCQEYDGTGYTYSALSQCSGSCLSYECTTNCCGIYNSPVYGTGGTYSTLGACTGSCVSWACNVETVSTGTTLYAYYDTTIMNVDEVQNRVNGVNIFASLAANGIGNVYHTFINDKRWLNWGTSVYSGHTTGSTILQATQAGLNIQSALLSQVANPQLYTNTSFYDNCVPGTPYPLLFDYSGNQIISRGPAPTASTSADVLTICFISQSTGINGLQQQNLYTGDFIAPGAVPQFSGGSNTTLYQPTSSWKSDYSSFIDEWTIISATSANARFVLYPTMHTSGGQGNLNDTYKLFALHGLAAISSGNKPVEDGTWQIGTAPRKASSGGILNGTPGLCMKADLTALELPQNPYVLENVGKLDQNGWNMNYEFKSYGGAGGLMSYLNSVLMLTTTATTGCISACTTPTQFYPYTSITECAASTTSKCNSYTCTDTGCIVATGTSIGLYSTLEDCTGGTTSLPPCTSYNCSGSGCTEQTGSGGTYSTSKLCLGACTSWSCPTYQLSNPPYQVGCYNTLGSGGTYTTYSACTGGCRSWECLSPCSGGTTGSCIEYPHTGGTYSSATLCSGSCEASWWCVPTINTDTCLNKTYVTFTEGIPSSAINAIQYIANPLNGLQTTQLVTMKYDTFALAPQSPCNGMVPSTHISYLTYVVYSAPATAAFPGVHILHSWEEILNFQQSEGFNVTLTSTFNTVMANWTDTNRDGSMSQFWGLGYDYCECVSTLCSVECVGGTSTSIPTNWSGPFSTSGSAFNECCANTWNCIPEQDLNSCSGKTQIPGVYTGVTSALNWVSTNMPNVDVSTLMFESLVQATPPTTNCSGPNGGILKTFDGIAYSLLSNGQMYSNWNLFISGLIGTGLNTASSGMSLTQINYLLNTNSGSSLSVCEGICYCEHIDCSCTEVVGSGGTYATQTQCQSGCCPTVYSATSWNCESSGNYAPICQTKTDIGVFSSPMDTMEHFRTNQPNTTFGLNRFVYIWETLGVSLVNGLIGDQTTLLNIFTETPYSWTECYVNLDSYLPNWVWEDDFFAPYNYITKISHPLISGGGYTTWNSFYNDVVAAGVTGVAGESVSSVCSAITYQLNPLGNQLSFGCVIEKERCCSPKPCYCYELFESGGTYTTEPNCISNCCPCDDPNWVNLPLGGTVGQPNYNYGKNNYCDRCATVGSFPVSWDANTGNWYYDLINGVDYCQCCTPEPEGWTCNTPLGICITAIQANTPPSQFFTTQIACTSSLTNPQGPCYSVTSWNCTPSGIVDKCSDSMGYINEVSPGTVGNQNGTPFSTTSITYPFTSSTLTATTSPVVPQQAEAVLTNSTYWDPTVNFSAATWEWEPTPTYQIPNNTCIGPYGNPVFRLVSVANAEVNNHTQYYNWQTFVTAAASQGVNITTSLNINEVIGLPYWNIVIEPCICTTSDSGCTCVEIVGNAGAYSSQILCEQYCCEIPVTYNCTSVGCVDPLDGSGSFSGVTGLKNCTSNCWEYICDPNGTSFDDCSNTTPISSFVGTPYNVVSDVPGQTVLSTSILDAVNYIANPVNGLQNTTMASLKFVTDIAYYPLPTFVPSATIKITDGDVPSCFTNWLQSGWGGPSGTINSLDSCTTTMPYAPNATTNPTTLPVGSSISYNHWASISHIYIPILVNLNNNSGPASAGLGIDLQTQITASQTWTGFIDMLNNWNTTLTSVPSIPFNTSMTLVQVDNVVNSILNGLPNWIISNNPCGPGYNSPQFGHTPGCIVTAYRECCCSGSTCDCVPNTGTGNTAWNNSQYIPCFSGCCGGNVCDECTIFIVTNSEPVEVSSYDPITNTTNYLFTSPTVWISPDIANYSNKIWLYNNSVIEEWVMDFSNCSATLNRTIQIPTPIGVGLDAINATTLIGGSGNDRVINQIDISTSVPIFTPIVTLPWNEQVSGDILYDPSTSTFLVAIIRSGVVGNDSVLKTYSMGGALIETYNIPPAISAPQVASEQSVYGLYCFSGKTYLVTGDKREYEVLYNPLEVAPISTQTVSISDSEIYGTSISNECCGVPYRIPDTFDCIVNPITSNSNCQLNLLGTGLYTTLTSCQSGCTDCVTWNCIPGAQILSCSATTLWAPYLGPTSYVGMLNTISSSINGLQNTTFNTISWGDANTPGGPGYTGSGCLCINGMFVQKRFEGGISHNNLNTGTIYYTWADFVNASIIAGIQVTLNMTFLQVKSQVEGYYNNVPIKLPTEVGCLCTTTPCNCIQVYDGSGQYTTETDCISDAACCGGVSVGYNCDPACFVGCTPCYGTSCDYTEVLAINAGYVDALSHCQATCEPTPPTPTWECGGCGVAGQLPCVLNTSGTGPFLTLQDCLNNPCPCYYDCIPSLGDCSTVTYPTPYLTYNDCVTDPTTICNTTVSGCNICCESIGNGTIPPETIQLLTTTTPCTCPTSHPNQVSCHIFSGPCVQDVSCNVGYVWSWIYCQCICQPVSCAVGYVWNSLLCSCEPEISSQETTFIGTQAEVAVRIAEHVGESIQTITSKVITSVGELEDQIRRGREIDPLTGNLIIRCGDCNSTTAQVGVCLVGGCLEFKSYEEQDNSDVLVWRTLESGAKQTYDCYNGTCILVNGTEGSYTSLGECMGDCGGISSGGKKTSNVGTKTPAPTPSKQDGAMVFIATGDDPTVGEWHGPTNHPPAPKDKYPSFHSCCPTVHNGLNPSVNPCFHWDQFGGTGGFNLYTGAPVLGSGCGPAPGASSGVSDPEWCCEWALIVGSDIALKENTIKVGKSPSGINIYEFEYKDKTLGGGVFRGVIAQEVPQASTIGKDGYLYVDYTKIDVDFEKVR